MKQRKPQSKLPVPVKIEELRVRLQEWRQTRRLGTAIPAEVWSSAIELAREHGTAKVARLLSLDYCDLRKRLESNEEAPAQGARFLEVIPSLWSPGWEWLVELEDPKGARMRIQVKGATAPDLEALTRLLWSEGR
jgi:hypothetical protein